MSEFSPFSFENIININLNGWTTQAGAPISAADRITIANALKAADSVGEALI